MRCRSSFGQGGDDDEVCSPVRFLRVGGGAQVQVVMGQVLRYEGINDGGMPVVDHIDPLSVDIDSDDAVMLGQQHGIGHSDVAQSCNGNLHGRSFRGSP